MDDIVTRLRNRELCWCKDHIVAVCSACSERAEAADEIERLQAENDGLRIKIFTLIRKIEQLAVRGE